MSSNEERTGLRDMKLSNHLREYENCFITDLDGLLLGFNWEKPVGLFEMKHKNLVQIVKESYRYHVQAAITLADNSGIGFYYVIYNPDKWIFNIAPMNEYAQKDMESKTPQIYSDADFYRFQCKLRSKAPVKEFSEVKDWCHPEMRKHILDAA